MGEDIDKSKVPRFLWPTMYIVQGIVVAKPRLQNFVLKDCTWVWGQPLPWYSHSSTWPVMVIVARPF